MPASPTLDSAARVASLQASVADLVDDVLTPALVIDLSAVEHNIDAVQKRAGRDRWRPHIKTAKQSRVLRTLLQRRVRRLKCATIDELALALDTAERVDPDGRVDVLLAVSPTPSVLRAIAELQHLYEGGEVQVLTDGPEHWQKLGPWARTAKVPRELGVLLDLDVGMHRSGADVTRWLAVAKTITTNPPLVVRGVHAYEGHLAWDAASEAVRGYDDTVTLLRALPARSAQWVMTSGSHSYAQALAYTQWQSGDWTHQICPGTVLLGDLATAPAMQDMRLEQAAFVMTRVVARPGDDVVVLDAGSKAIAPDRKAPACEVLDWPELVDQGASEELRPFRANDHRRPDYGEVVWLVPDHVCTTVNLFRHVLYVRKDKFVARGLVEAASRSLKIDDPRP